MFMHLAAAAVLLLQTTGAPKAPAPKPAQPKAAAAAKPAATDIAVTLTYKGKGTVDAQHQLIAWLFTEPNITANSVGSSRVDLQACKLEYSIVSPK